MGLLREKERRLVIYSTILVEKAKRGKIVPVKYKIVGWASPIKG